MFSFQGLEQGVIFIVPHLLWHGIRSRGLGGVGSSYTFGYRHTAEIVKTPHSYSQYFWMHSCISVENRDPIIYFITILWPVFIYINSIYVCVLFFTLVGPNWQMKYSILFCFILFYIVAACKKLEGEFQRIRFSGLIRRIAQCSYLLRYETKVNRELLW
jgi:hypothetical protein